MKVSGLLCATMAVLLTGQQAWSSDILFAYDNVFSGSNPDGSTPWVKTWLTEVSPDTVMLSVSNFNLTTSEKLTELYLNLNPNFSASGLVFSFLGGSPGVTAPLPALGTDSFKADGDGKYDIRFQFDQTPSGAFSAGDYLQYQITGIAGLTPADFVYLSLPAGGHGPFYSAIHVQGIEATGVTDTTSLSGWVSPTTVTQVPEPSVGALILLGGGAGLGILQLRRNTASRG